MTTNTSNSDNENCLNAGMDDFINKPVSVDKMNQILEKWIPQKKLS